MEYKISDRIASLKPSAIREILKATAGGDVVPFSAGNPAPEAFPVDAVREITADILARDPITALQYGISEGYTPLRETVKKYMSEKHNVFGEDDDIIITSGAQQVMDLATKALCDLGDTVICECPSFIGSLNCFRSYGCKLAGVPVKIICPSHGIIWRKDPSKVLSLYDKWSKHEAEEGVVIIYASMYGNTEKSFLW